MTFFNTWVLLIAALIAPEGTFLRQCQRWTPINKQQKSFLKKVTNHKRDLQNFAPEELQAWASDDAAKLNQIAAEKQIPIIFDSFDEGEFGSLALLQLDLAWKKTPVQKEMVYTNAQKEATSIKGLLFRNGFRVYTSKYHSSPIAKIKTSSGDLLCVTTAEDALEGFALSQKIKRIQRSLVKTNKHAYSELLMPQISYEGFIDISWLNGLTTVNQDFAIKRAVEYLKLTV